MRIDERIMKLATASIVAACALAAPPLARAQGSGPQTADLARQIERRFTVLPITGGVVLTPRSGISSVKSIEVANGTIAIDGTPVTGAELRQKLGADADPVIQLSYLSPSDQRALAVPPGAAPAPPPPVEPPPPPAPRERRPSFQFAPRGRGDDILHIGRETRVEAGQIV